jgi:CubicO group peptidase (beta-lactamase class C family)
MMQNQINDLWGGGKYYGLAFGVVNKKGVADGGIGSEGTFDWGGYFNTQYFADPQEKVIGLIFKQTQGRVDDNTGWQFRQMVMAAIDD